MYSKATLISILLIIGCLSCNKNYQQNKMDYDYIKLNEGKEIDIIGKLKPPKIFPHHFLILSDKTQLIIGLSNNFIDKNKVLIRKNKGKAIKIIGKVYTDNIPKEYGIIGRDSRPYILDVKSIELLKK